ncbi:MULTISPECIES: TonB-dependent receptor [unclassified Arcicella]|uniref:TonB-dependent receptor n=1 Tax=unclassified Arcicella TaxID=2644986 RepID=UPI00286359EC|nr:MULTISPECIES: TonB-dependent receptor [unclassified Arcicella]MDR6560046.1 TonB-linked SusC/RagA family outer membrane protein [Arcicella sp. BE51]MDR6810347.1 TonB-linked SusC/RagA family outer membrane protein [Arcicella sp. BE140]MDR6821697.1 TonB-linked SusC/RagA family outer membrane protein [Arcicella sp. BE139]
MKKTLQIHKLLLTAMKITLTQVFLAIGLMSSTFASNTNAQNVLSQRVTLQAQELGMRSVLTQIEKQTDVKFVFSSKLIQSNRKISVDFQNAQLSKIFDNLFKPLHLTYEISGKMVIINRSTGSSSTTNTLQESDDILSIEILEQTITGTVTDETGQVLPGVNILIKGTQRGAITDAKGQYKISVPDNNAVLIFSSIGFQKREVVVGGKSVLNITLSTDAQSLDEVVVVGYGTEKKVTVTGSVVSVKGSEVVQSPSMNVSNSLVGRLPGLVAVTSSGEPGYDGATLRIRGVNTLGDSSPLVVVDGVPGRSLERLDPSTIESITILKDASAAIYGAQAANGVILVTTKRGASGKPTITFNLNQGFGQPTRLPAMANAAEYATMLNEIDAYANRTGRFTAQEVQKFRDGSDPWRYPNTDWFGAVLKPSSSQNYANIGIAGGSDNFKYFVSFGAKSQDGYYKNSGTKYNQYDFRSNIDAKISKNISFGFDVSGRMEDRNYPTRNAGSIFRMVMRGKPNLPAYWPDGTPGPDIEYGDNPAVVSTDATGYDRDKWYYLNSNMKLNIQIPWVKGLSFLTTASIDKGLRFDKRFETPWYLYSWDGQTVDASGKPVLVKGKKGFDDARLTEQMEDNHSILMNSILNYERQIGSHHYMKFMVGTETRSGQMDKFSAYRRYFVSTAIDQLFAGGDLQKDNNGSASQNARRNFFGRVNYNYKEKYLAEFVWRYDGSYIFPADKRYGFFPGVSLGWRLSEEEFWKDKVSFIDNMKLRASWGQTGNDRIAEWQYLSSYGFFANSGGVPQPLILGIDQENKTLYETRIPNLNVTWEVANQANVGFDMQLLKDKLSFSADYFYNTRSQILWPRNASVPTSTGLTLPSENIGKVANTGFEFDINYHNKSRDFSYQLGFNGGYSKNKIVFWDEAPGAPDYQKTTGYPIPTDPKNPTADLYYNAIGIFKDQASVDAYPHWDNARPGDVIFEDVNKDGKIDGNDRIRNTKSNIPRFTTGFTANLRYKQFDLSILFQGAFGAVNYISTESGEIGNFLKSFYNERWTPENPNASGPRTFNRSNEYWVSNRNTYFLKNTDYIRLKNIQFGYSLPKKLSQKLGLEGARIYVSGLNLWTFSPDYKDFDPEMGSGSGQGYPLQKVLNTGLSFTF